MSIFTKLGINTTLCPTCNQHHTDPTIQCTPCIQIAFDKLNWQLTQKFANCWPDLEKTIRSS